MQIVVLPGDGIGPEICAATLQVLARIDARLHLGLTFASHDIGLVSLKQNGVTITPAVIAAARAADAVILGPVSHNDYPPRDQGGINPSGELRKLFDLYANVRPSRTRPGLPYYGRTGMDLVFMRENTEGFYADRNMFQGSGEFMPTPDVALAVRKVTSLGSSRIARAGFDLARRRRKHVTAVHKANVLRVSDGLFLKEVRAVAKDYPDVGYDELIVDAMAALLVRNASRFDVVVTTNMFGDILSDEAAELSGSLGLAGSINAGEHHCLAQAQHGSAPDIAGKDKANPTSLILSVAMLLEWLAGRHANESLARGARVIDEALDAMLADPARRTADLGGKLGTAAFTESLCGEIDRRLTG